MTADPGSAPSVNFIGSNSPFSAGAFKALCESHLNITRLILAGYAPAEIPDTCLPILSPTDNNKSITSIQQIAAQHDIPTTFLGHPDDYQQQWESICTNCSEHSVPDYVFVACFPKKLPMVVLDWPHKTCINLHPSLLPAYRGPDPIFWQLHNNETNTGVSLHIINNNFDEGPVLYQKAISFPEGATNEELNLRLSKTGAQAFVQLLKNKHFITTKQDSSQASYQALPSDKDYTIQTTWSARQAYNFMRGTHTPANGYPVVLHGVTHYLIETLSNHYNQNMPKDFVNQTGSVQIRLSDGVLLAKSV